MSFYARLRDNRGDDELLQACIERVTDRLSDATDPSRPGMLLGKIQSGKTRAFLGVIARAFDRDFDTAVVLTKGTRTLASQTVKRIGRDFSEFLKRDEMVLFDIMEAPDRLTRAELRRKIVIVAKKQVDNLDRISQLFEKYPSLQDRRVLLVDDEADMASVRFTKKKGVAEYDQGRIANQIDELRRDVKGIAFLQVTATPYSLYMQPDDYDDASMASGVFYPKKPAFTEILPVHDAYVGGDDYFGGHGEDDPRHYLYVRVNDREHDALRSNDGRTIRGDRLWTSENIRLLRLSLISFLLAVAMRRRQQDELDQEPQKYAMIIHNDTQRAAHAWQVDVVERLSEAFEAAADEDDPRLRALVSEAYADLRLSVAANGGHMWPEAVMYSDVKTMILDGELNVQRVNSDVQLAPILDPDTAELRLRTKANLFIGGSILDRGITVPNLISFYYGRNPKRMQADTVLQHSRMYGARPRADLAVTRFYTSGGVYARLAQINSLERALREALENKAEDPGVVFIQSSSSAGFVPCAPSKISLSDVVAVRPSDILLPVNFDTVSKTALARGVAKVEKLLPVKNTAGKFATVSVADATAILDGLEATLEISEDSGFDWEAVRSLLTYYGDQAGDRVDLLIERGRRLNKKASGDRSGLSILGTPELRALVRSARKAPALILLEQVGEGFGWRAGPFFWPMLAAPSTMKPCVYARRVAK